MTWVIVKVQHGDADKVHIETRDTEEEMLKRVHNLIAQVKEDDEPIKEENLCDEFEVRYGEWWWNVEFEHGTLITINAEDKMIHTVTTHILNE